MTSLLVAAIPALLAAILLVACSTEPVESTEPAPGEMENPSVPSNTPQVPEPTQDNEREKSFDAALLISVADLRAKIVQVPSDYQVVDIRSYGDWWTDRLPDSVNIPSGMQFELRIREIAVGKTVVLVSDASHSGVASSLAAIEATYGDTAHLLAPQDGMEGWKQASFPTDVSPLDHC